MKISIYKKVTILILSIIFTEQLFGYAHTRLMLENNCKTDAVFTINDQSNNTVITKVLKPNQYYTTKELSNDNFLLSTTSNYDISFKSQNASGLVKYELSNSFFYFGEKGANKALFKDVIGNVEINHRLHNDNYEYYWTNYSVNIANLVNGSLIVPSFTISACHREIDTSDSLLSGVEKVLIFGDSLSDRGNLYRYSLQLLPKSTPYYRGMFSNGEVWSEQFANRLFLNNILVSNYAVGGSTVVRFSDWTENGSAYILEDEIALYLNIEAKIDAKDNLAIFFVGGNDYLTSYPEMSDIKSAVKAVTDGIFSAIEKVNAKKTVIVGLPDLSITGESKSLKNEKILKKLSKEHNEALKKYAKKHNMKFIDIAPIFEEMTIDTKNFNTKYNANISPKHIKDSCWSGGYFISKKSKIDNLYTYLKAKEDSKNIAKMDSMLEEHSLQSILDAGYSGIMCNDPQQYAFWDHVHPTYQVHRALYEYIVKELGAKSFTKEKLS